MLSRISFCFHVLSFGTVQQTRVLASKLGVVWREDGVTYLVALVEEVLCASGLKPRPESEKKSFL